jgi:ATP/maltotriose-dependent transcriptional regulator MalT
LDYFRGEILSGLSDQLRQAIYSLAWLEKIPAELAEAMGYARESLEAGALAPHLICAVNI